ncbi:MAG TPA: hypothetical protein VJ063_20530, partial [Verrucomicrobiae bacterium]|nr:hypothetical protein [Verrucomicrobiae bacterium]
MPERLLVRARRFVRTDPDARIGNASRQPAKASAPSHELVVRPGQRLAAIEGLRGYLALWVLVCHVMWSSGFEVNALSMLPQIVAKGRYAVEVFMIISGFVIFFLLDKQRENY